MDWCRHEEWALEYLEENYPFKEYADIYWKIDGDGTRNYYSGRDCLVYCLGWVLLHNPYQGMAVATYDKTRNLTKAQKEFLYDYYIERNKHEEANAIYKQEAVV